MESYSLHEYKNIIKEVYQYNKTTNQRIFETKQKLNLLKLAGIWVLLSHIFHCINFLSSILDWIDVEGNNIYVRHVASEVDQKNGM